eukprot:TRINITY_DN29257_c0_g1_i1.p1 TRINITY_DN29257_c0_g1~~TRINITY_DN29257_c0_g1_i1.p1  ORF type:complete len:540 (+),score=104.34 TRINITY_DN29257_c0_g1_i1:74-1693(+)
MDLRLSWRSLRCICCSSAVLATLTVLLTGCGGGGGPSPAPAPPGSEKVACPKTMLRAHCTGECLHDPATDEYSCLTCESPYKLDGKVCAVSCSDLPAPAARPARPETALEHNGIEWPDACFDGEDEVNFFAIGDWGGVCSWPNFDHSDPTKDLCQHPNWRPAGVMPGKPFPMDTYKRLSHVDTNAQVIVADKMMRMYKNLSDQGHAPKFVINVGDSFYPGGIEEHCSNKVGSDLDKIMMQYQFNAVFENIYNDPGSGFNNLEWWGVLGNHDYGGNCYIKAWDQLIYYTWKPNGRWVIPAPYWKRHVQFRRFDADFFFLDVNVLDTERPDDNPKQNICFRKGNTGQSDPENHCHFEDYPASGFQNQSCPKTNGPMDPDDCVKWFHKLWADNKQWLDKHLEASKADWQIIVLHYPVKYGPPGLDWRSYAKEHGIDLIIAGHQHFQAVYYEAPIKDLPSLNLGPTVNVIVGGGGGIQTDVAPIASGHDDSYGFMVMKLSVENLDVQAYTHAGGMGPRQVLRNHTVAKYVERAGGDGKEELVI